MRYFYFVCGTAPIQVLPQPIAGLGEHYSEKRTIEVLQELGALRAEAWALRAEVAEIKASRSFRYARRIAGVLRGRR